MDTLRPKLTLLNKEPTPLQYAPSLSQELFREIYVKRDDLTPWGGGGNKLRKLEYLMFEAMQEDGYRIMDAQHVMLSNDEYPNYKVIIFYK